MSLFDMIWAIENGKKIKILAQENNQVRLLEEMTKASTLSEKKPPLQDVWKAQLAPVKSRSRTLRDKKALSLASSLESLKIIFDAKMMSVFDPCSRVNNSKSSTSGNRIRILSDVRCRAAIVIKSLSWRWFTFFLFQDCILSKYDLSFLT